MNREQFEICTMLGSVLRGEEPDTAVEDCGNAVICAEENEVFELIYPYICNQLPEKIKSIFDIKLMQSSMLCENILYEWKRISEYAESKKIYLLMLKGIVNRDYYSDPRSRQMIDIDLYFKSEQKEKISEMMTNLGYRNYEYSTKHTHWHNPTNNISVEMHHSLFDEDGVGKKFYSDSVERSEKVDGFENIFRMNDTDNYIYTLAHFHRHFTHSTANLKQIADLFVIESKTELDHKRIEKETKEIGINEFYKNTKELIDSVFNKKEKPEKKIEDFADIILKNKPFFCENKNEKKITKILKLLFPKPAKIYAFFPFVYKHKFLLPLGYLLRIIKCFKSDKNIIKEKLK